MRKENVRNRVECSLLRPPTVKRLRIFIGRNPILSLDIQNIEEEVPIADQFVVEPGIGRMIDFEKIEWGEDSKQGSGFADKFLPSLGGVKGISIMPSNLQVDQEVMQYA